jgi:hypothetical protein
MRIPVAIAKHVMTRRPISFLFACCILGSCIFCVPSHA